MTYGDYAKEREKYKKIIKIIIIIMGAYSIITLFKETIILGLLLMVVWLIPGLSIYSLLQKNYDKKKQEEMMLNFSHDMIIQPIKRKKLKGYNRYGNEFYIIPMVLLFGIIILESYSSFSIQIIHIGVIVFICLILFLITKQFSKYKLIFFEEGLIISQKLYKYDDIKKYQKIKMRNNHYILEIQAGKNYFSMVLSKEYIEMFELALLNNAS